MPYDISLLRQGLFHKSGYSGGSQTIFKRYEYMQKPHSKDHSLAVWVAKVMAEGDKQQQQLSALCLRSTMT